MLDHACHLCLVNDRPRCQEGLGVGSQESLSGDFPSAEGLFRSKPSGTAAAARHRLVWRRRLLRDPVWTWV
jgi:hypothetical protein